MKSNMFFLSFLLVYLACSLFLTTTVHSAGIKERMAARLPTIDKLKDQGAIGENNQGYLEYRIAERPEQEVVTAENEDRGTVYTMIGKKQGAPASLVGQTRAQQIAERGPAGHWYQNPDGSWYQK